MASESHDSRRKHRRSLSSDDEAERSSKRHKHRHHHRQHHRHRSKKNEEESKREGDDVNALHAPPPMAIYNSRLDDDVEEGEILEEEGFNFGGGEHEIADKKSESGDESGEIEAFGVRGSDRGNLVCSDCPNA